MPNPTQISLLDYHFEAKACNALLTAMLNHSDIDYACYFCYFCCAVAQFLPAVSLYLAGFRCSVSEFGA